MSSELKDVRNEELRNAVRSIVGFGDGPNIERTYLRGLLHALALNNHQAKERLQLLELLPMNPNRTTGEAHKVDKRMDGMKEPVAQLVKNGKESTYVPRKHGIVYGQIKDEIPPHSVPKKRVQQEDLHIHESEPKKPRQLSAPSNTVKPPVPVFTCEICHSSFAPSEITSIEDPENHRTHLACRPCHEASSRCKQCHQQIEISWHKNGAPMDRCKDHREVVCEACEKVFAPEPKQYVEWYDDFKTRIVCQPCWKEKHICEYEEGGRHTFGGPAWDFDGKLVRLCQDHLYLQECEICGVKDEGVCEYVPGSVRCAPCVSKPQIDAMLGYGWQSPSRRYRRSRRS